MRGTGPAIRSGQVVLSPRWPSRRPAATGQRHATGRLVWSQRRRTCSRTRAGFQVVVIQPGQLQPGVHHERAHRAGDVAASETRRWSGVSRCRHRASLVTGDVMKRKAPRDEDAAISASAWSMAGIAHSVKTLTTWSTLASSSGSAWASMPMYSTGTVLAATLSAASLRATAEGSTARTRCHGRRVERHVQPRPEADFKDLATEPSGDPGPQPCRLLAAQRTIRHTRKNLLLVETHPTSLGRPASSIKNPMAPPAHLMVPPRAGSSAGLTVAIYWFVGADVTDALVACRDPEILHRGRSGCPHGREWRRRTRRCARFSCRSWLARILIG